MRLIYADMHCRGSLHWQDNAQGWEQWNGTDMMITSEHPVSKANRHAAHLSTKVQHSHCCPEPLHHLPKAEPLNSSLMQHA